MNLNGNTYILTSKTVSYRVYITVIEKNLNFRKYKTPLYHLKPKFTS